MIVVCALLPACDLLKPRAEMQPASQPASQPIGDGFPVEESFTASRVDESGASELRPARAQLVMGVMNVRIPESSAAAAEAVWEHVREEMLDARTRLRLMDNGFRVGIGHVRLWQPIRDILDAIDGHVVAQTTPVKVPVGFPLALELDAEPRSQTLFYVGRDGTLRGETWPGSRNVLRTAYGPDPRRADRILLGVVPEVHQNPEGWRWVRTQEGLWQVPQQNRFAFEDVAFEVSLAKDEFLLVAPSESAKLSGIVGRAMMTSENQSRGYFSFLFIRPEVSDVGQRD